MIKENFIKLYENSFRENWDLPCYTDYGESVHYTYGQVAGEIARMHLLFKHCSLRRGDKIAVIGKNNAHWCIAFPKNNSGRDVMLNAPSVLAESQLEELCIKVNPKN